MEHRTAHKNRRENMGPISRVSAGSADPYLQWRERLEEKRAEKKETEQDKASKKADGNKPEKYMGSTDKVDREIEKLKKRKKELEGQLRTEQDENKVRSLERELAQVERELSQKDNDGYRRQHMTMTKL
jgi:hypothetical protein